MPDASLGGVNFEFKSDDKGLQEALKNLRKAFMSLDETLRQTSEQMGEFSQAEDKTEASSSKFVRGLRGLQRVVAELTSGLSGLTITAGVSFAAAITASEAAIGLLAMTIGKQLVVKLQEWFDLGLELEKQQFGLTAAVENYHRMTGDASLSTGQFGEELQMLSRTTGVVQQDLQQAALVMLDMSRVTGLNGQQIQQLIARASEFSVVAKQDFMTVIYGIDQAMRGFPQILRGMGVELGDVASQGDNTSATFDKLAKFLHDTEFAAGKVSTAFKTTVFGAIQENETAWANLNQAISKTVTQLEGPVVTAFNKVSAAVADTLLPFSGLIAYFTSFAGPALYFIGSVVSIISILGALVLAVAAVSGALTALNLSTLPAIVGGVAAFNKVLTVVWHSVLVVGRYLLGALPMILAVGGALAVLGTELYRYWQRSKTRVDDLSSEIGRMNQEIDALENAQRVVQELGNKTNRTAKEQQTYNNAVSELERLLPAVVSHKTAESNAIEINNGLLKTELDIRRDIVEMRKIELIFERPKIEKQMEDRNKKIQEQRDLLQGHIDRIQELSKVWDAISANLSKQGVSLDKQQGHPAFRALMQERELAAERAQQIGALQRLQMADLDVLKEIDRMTGRTPTVPEVHQDPLASLQERIQYQQQLLSKIQQEEEISKQIVQNRIDEIEALRGQSGPLTMVNERNEEILKLQREQADISAKSLDKQYAVQQEIFRLRRSQIEKDYPELSHDAAVQASRKSALASLELDQKMAKDRFKADKEQLYKRFSLEEQVQKNETERIMEGHRQQITVLDHEITIQRLANSKDYWDQRKLIESEGALEILQENQNFFNIMRNGEVRNIHELQLLRDAHDKRIQKIEEQTRQRIVDLNQEIINKVTGTSVAQAEAYLQIAETLYMSESETRRRRIALIEAEIDRNETLLKTVKMEVHERLKLKAQTDVLRAQKAIEERREAGGIFEGLREGFIGQIRDVDSAFGLFRDMARSTAQGMQQSFSTYFFNWFTGQITDVKQLVGNFLATIASQIASTLISIMTIKAITGAMGFFAPGGGELGETGLEGVAQFTHKAGGRIQGYPTGGHIAGPVSRSGGDNVIIQAQAGEFMIRKAAADMWGPAFLNAINNGVMPQSHMPKAGDVEVNVVNSGREDKPEVNVRDTLRGMVVDIIFQDVQANGSLRGLLKGGVTR